MINAMKRNVTENVGKFFRNFFFKKIRFNIKSDSVAMASEKKQKLEGTDLVVAKPSDRACIVKDFMGFDYLFSTRAGGGTFIISGHTVDIVYCDVTLKEDLSNIDGMLYNGAQIPKVIVTLIEGFIEFWLNTTDFVRVRINSIGLVRKGTPVIMKKKYDAYGLLEMS